MVDDGWTPLGKLLCFVERDPLRVHLFRRPKAIIAAEAIVGIGEDEVATGELILNLFKPLVPPVLAATNWNLGDIDRFIGKDGVTQNARVSLFPRLTAYPRRPNPSGYRTVDNRDAATSRPAWDIQYDSHHPFLVEPGSVHRYHATPRRFPALMPVAIRTSRNLLYRRHINPASHTSSFSTVRLDAMRETTPD